MKHEAIYNLYPNVTHITENNGLFTALDINEQEVSIDMDAVNTKATELQTAYDNEQETLKTNKVSGFRKMGLTDDEILAQDNSLEEYL
jgi:hypothetical protein